MIHYNYLAYILGTLFTERTDIDLLWKTYLSRVRLHWSYSTVNCIGYNELACRDRMASSSSTQIGASVQFAGRIDPMWRVPWLLRLHTPVARER